MTTESNFEKNVLYIETSLKNSYIAFKKSYNTSIEIIYFDSNKALEEITPSITSLLKKYNLTYNDLDIVYIPEGPGSSTGIRLSMTFVKILLLVNTKVEIRVVNLFKECQVLFSKLIPVVYDRHNKLLNYVFDSENFSVRKLDEEKLVSPLSYILINSKSNRIKFNVDSLDLLVKATKYKTYHKDTIGLMKPIYPDIK